MCTYIQQFFHLLCCSCWPTRQNPDDNDDVFEAVVEQAVEGQELQEIQEEEDLPDPEEEPQVGPSTTSAEDAAKQAEFEKEAIAAEQYKLQYEKLTMLRGGRDPESRLFARHNELYRYDFSDPYSRCVDCSDLRAPPRRTTRRPTPPVLPRIPLGLSPIAERKVETTD
ncbi:unnamed protein product [Orchesella dallaii]|uniref:Uncharacterized protein n=1 Tax=Orchesella dallaii TaxID=48710 RepID=A0ABP1RVB5_9HEXA